MDRLLTHLRAHWVDLAWLLIGLWVMFGLGYALGHYPQLVRHDTTSTARPLPVPTVRMHP